MNIRHIVALWLLLINLIGFIAFYTDKQKAIHHKWRTPESALFLCALLGGGPGCLIAMHIFRHKTKHPTFVIGIPLITLIELGVILGISYYFSTSLF